MILIARAFNCKRAAPTFCQYGKLYTPYSKKHERMSSSTSAQKDQEYCNILFKRFLFQIHPDFFSNYKKEKAINEANIQKLTELIGNHQNIGTVRTLTFYLKPMEVEEMPKRVKVSISSITRLIDSIIDILETIGAEIPERPFGRTVESSRFTATSSEEVNRFLDSLLDKRELILWRKERLAKLESQLDFLRKLLGVEVVDMRFNWSPSNTSVLLRSLALLVNANRENIILPWTGMTLVLAFEDCLESRVDCIEGSITISPSQTPLQWLEPFTNVTQEMIEKTKMYQSKRKRMISRAEKEITRLIGNLSSKEGAVTRIHNNVSYSWSGSRSVLVRLRRGNSCSKQWYHRFLETNFSEINNEIDSTASSVSISDSQNFHVSKSSLIIDIVVEQGYGTKVLESGTVRLDAGICKPSIEEFLSIHFKSIFNYTVRSIRTRRELKNLQEKVRTKFEFSTLTAGIGVTEDMMSSCLSRLVELPKSRLKDLYGFDIRIGRYLGIDHDGAVILPWEIQF